MTIHQLVSRADGTGSPSWRPTTRRPDRDHQQIRSLRRLRDLPCSRHRRWCTGVAGSHRIPGINQLNRGTSKGSLLVGGPFTRPPRIGQPRPDSANRRQPASGGTAARAAIPSTATGRSAPVTRSPVVTDRRIVSAVSRIGFRFHRPDLRVQRVMVALPLTAPGL